MIDERRQLMSHWERIWEDPVAWLQLYKAEGLDELSLRRSAAQAICRDTSDSDMQRVRGGKELEHVGDNLAKREIIYTFTTIATIATSIAGA